MRKILYRNYNSITRLFIIYKHEQFLPRYSDCYPITHVSTDFSGPDQVEYIMVECSKARIFSPVAYRGFHAFAQPYPKRSDVIRDKIRYWQNASELPPNILILGTDTTSRLNFRRNMIKSTEVLEGLGAFEMKGYTKCKLISQDNPVNN